MSIEIELSGLLCSSVSCSSNMHEIKLVLLPRSVKNDQAFVVCGVLFHKAVNYDHYNSVKDKPRKL